MDGEEMKVVRCTEENAHEFRALVKAWPELGALVSGLQAQSRFPGLRALTVTLPAAQARQRGAVGVLAAQIAQEAAQEPRHAH